MDKKTCILAIDTTDHHTGIGLAAAGPEGAPVRGDRLLKIKTWLSQRNQSQELLPKIDQLLKANQVKPAQLKWIVANLGPGSFTGLRVGISVANAFGYGLQIPVIGQAHLQGEIKTRIKTLLNLTTNLKKFQQVLPVYGSEPHITSSKKR